MSRKKAMLFDLDGTLLDTNALIVETFQHTFRKHLNRELDEAEIHGFFGEHLPHTLKRYGGDKADQMLATYREHNLSRHDEMVRPFPGVVETLPQLHRLGVRLAVVTVKRDSTARRGLALFGLEPYIDCLVGGDAPVAPKPSPEPIALALRELGVNPADALMVGDSGYDIAAAHAAGVEVWAVSWSTTSRDKLLALGADRILERMEELLALAR